MDSEPLTVRRFYGWNLPVSTEGEFGKMATRPARTTWKGHELVTKAIFEALLKQDNIPNLEMEIKHNVTIPGLKTTHQIDVYWKFRVGGIDHIVIVQVKKERARAKQGDLLLFCAVLNDIPGQPMGIFVCQNGYQKGAAHVARTQGIATFEIREVSRNAPRPGVTMTDLAIATMHFRPDTISLEMAIFEPTLNSINVVVDELWFARHPAGWVGFPTIVGLFAEGVFLDGDGNVRTTMRTLVKTRMREFGQEGQTSLEAEFPDPTYLSGVTLADEGATSLPKLKVLSLAAILDVTKTTRITPLFTSAAATYLFKNAVENDHRYVLITENGADFAAHLSLRLR